MKPKQMVAITLIIILVANLVLLGFGLINQMPFWIVIIVIAIISWKGFSMVAK